MKIITETERLILREIEFTDEEVIFALDSDPEVLKYLEEPVMITIEESREKIGRVRQQYLTTGVGRWALAEKATGEFLGWAGLKLENPRLYHSEKYYDVGYRLLRKHWGKGFASEAAKASVLYGFQKLGIREIFADVESDNLASKKVLEKTGLTYLRSFYNKGVSVDWYRIANPYG